MILRKILFLITFVQAAALHAQSTMIDQKAAYDIFKANVYPYIRQNCSSCHSETSTYPQGPQHSHSNPTSAFQVFSKYINIEDSDKSMIMRMVTNQHYCKDHQENCQNADQITNDMAAIMKKYNLDVKAASQKMNLPDNSNAAGKNIELGELNPITLMTQAQKIPSADSFTLKYDISSSCMKNSSDRRMIDLRFKRIQQNYFTLEQVSLTSHPGAIHIKGLYFFINGQAYANQTGYESLDRVVYFPLLKPKGGISNQELPAYLPVVQLHLGDNLQIGFQSLRENVEFSSVVCDKLKDNFAGQNIFSPSPDYDRLVSVQTIAYSIPYKNPKELCLQIDADIDRQNPRRSTIIVNDSKLSLKGYLLPIVKKWIEYENFLKAQKKD